MTNVYVTDSDEEAIVDSVKDNARKKFLWELILRVTSGLLRCARPGLTCNRHIV